MVDGDAKIAGRAVEEVDAAALGRSFEVRPPGAVSFRLEIDEVVLTRVVSNRLEVEMWGLPGGLRTLTTA